MTDPVDARTLHAQRHLFSMVARGLDADSICADMKTLGWPTDVVLETVHAMLNGVMMGNGLSPTERARFVLAGTAEEDPRATGGWRLRGRAASTTDVIRAANVVLTNFSMPLIPYPSVKPLGEMAS